MLDKKIVYSFLLVSFCIVVVLFCVFKFLKCYKNIKIIIIILVFHFVELILSPILHTMYFLEKDIVCKFLLLMKLE